MFETGTIVAIIMALSEAIKRTDILDAKYIPILNLVIGIFLSGAWDSSDLRIAVFHGIMAGLTASGLYSGTKNVLEGVKKQ